MAPSLPPPRPPGFKLLLEVFSVIHGPQEECVQALKNGHLLGISPGGVREALFSDETYPLLWGKRKGFAQVALDSQVVSPPSASGTFVTKCLVSNRPLVLAVFQPVIPMFTQNVREGFRSLGTLSECGEQEKNTSGQEHIYQKITGFFSFSTSIRVLLFPCRIVPVALREVSTPSSPNLWRISCQVSNLPRGSDPLRPRHNCSRACREGQ